MPKMSPEDIVKLLTTYRGEGDDARRKGWGERELIWEGNNDLYWSRFDFSNKANWQSKVPMPEGALYIDRWAAALRAALIIPGVWYTVDTEIPELEPAFRKFLGYYLDRCGTTPLGHVVGYDRVFEDQAKLAALMACACDVTWEPWNPVTRHGSRVKVNTLDPRDIILDPTNRNCYRVVRREVDYYQLLAEAKAHPDFYNLGEIKNLGASRAADEEADKERLTGHGIAVSARRKPIVLDEYYAVILSDEGEEEYQGQQLCVVANEHYLVSGPRPNPHAHGMDWLVFSAAISVPLSVYGKTYVETWGDIARAFVEMTNIIIDSGMMAGMNAFALAADLLKDPKQATSGVFPNKLFVLKPGVPAKDFINVIQLGNLSSAAVGVLELLKKEMREGAATNDLDVGQSVPKGDVTATEINAVEKGGTALIQSIATSLETGNVDPTLNLVFMTALENLPDTVEDMEDPQWKSLARWLGPEYFTMFVTQKQEFLAQPPAFRARGISGLIERGQKLSAMMQIIQALGSSPILQQALLQSIGFTKFVRQLIILVGLDPNDFPPDQLSMMAMQPQQPQQAPQ